jgi:acyl dehydratase
MKDGAQHRESHFPKVLNLVHGLHSSGVGTQIVTTDAIEMSDGSLDA